jgi:acyl-coenzyme A synthetase/AMP-(fatty) acid ligase
MTGPYRSFHAIVAENARRAPERTYVHCIDQAKSLSYGELYSASNRIARALKSLGLRANDRVLLLAENSVENLAVFVGTLRYGATIATVHVEMNQAHLAEIVRAVNPKLALLQEGLGLEGLRAGQPGEWIGLESFFAKIAELSDCDDIPSVAEPDSLGVIFYTSGTVAKPKGVIQTHATAFYNYDATADYLQLMPGDRVLDCRSYSWLSAQHMSLGAPLVAGATTIMAKHFSQSRYFDWLREHEINIGFVVPTMVAMLLARPQTVTVEELPHLRFLTSSSAPLLEEQWRSFETRYGITLCQSAGASEAGNMAAHRGAARKIGTIGPPLKHQRLRIDNGEIIVGGGRQQAYGYLNPDGSIERLPPEYRTGDLGFLDEEGHLRITGRAKELIIRGGVNISPVEIDDVLAAHAAVAEAGTVGVPHPIYGEEVVSFVTLRQGTSATAAELTAHCATRLPGFKVPKQIFVRNELPKNARGKLDRRALSEAWKRDMAQEGH